MECASQFVRCFLIKDFRDKGQSLSWEQILNTHFPIKCFHKKVKFQTIWSFADKDTHIAKFLSSELPLLLIIVIMAHTQEALPDIH